MLPLSIYTKVPLMLSKHIYSETIEQQNSQAAGNVLRRVMDILIPFLSLWILWLPFSLIALWIKLDSSGPILHHSVRVGKGGQHFSIYKFRTMIINADKQGPAITAASDSRITRSGKFLRNTKLDELPQLLNVLVGDMSLVGPRPEDPRYVALYTPDQRRVLDTRPGITSAASLEFRNEEALLMQENWEEVYREQIMPKKLSIDLEYLSQRTLGTDIKLVVKTVCCMFE